jgi:hypothetical protein
MSGLTTKELKLTPAGAAGAATANARVGIPPARLAGLQINYTSQPGATTDVVVKCVYAGLEKTLLTLTNIATDRALFSITESLTDAAGAALVGPNPSPTVQLPLVAGELTVDVTGGDPVANGVVVEFLLDVF